MPSYVENFPVGSKVRIVGASQLNEFLKTWQFHNKLEPAQLEYAGHLSEVKSVGFYHGGDVLYQLADIPGIWHEQCLTDNI